MLAILDLKCWKPPNIGQPAVEGDYARCAWCIHRDEALRKLEESGVPREIGSEAFRRHRATGRLGVMPSLEVIVYPPGATSTRAGDKLGVMPGPEIIFYANETMREWKQQQRGGPKKALKKVTQNARARKAINVKNRQQKIIAAVGKRLAKNRCDSVDKARHVVAKDHQGEKGWSYSSIRRATLGMEKKDFSIRLTLSE
jgi:hypothetical protein